MKKSPPSFEAIGGYGDYYAIDEERKVIRVNFQSAEETLCDKYDAPNVQEAIRQHKQAAYEFIRYFRKFITMDLVEKQFAVLDAVRTSPQAADYFLNHEEELGSVFFINLATQRAKEIVAKISK